MSVSEVRNTRLPVSTSTQGPKKVPMPLERTVQQTRQEEDKAGKPVITEKEKQYFESLFPQAAQEIRPYQVYTQKGNKTVVLSGTLVDRKG